MRKPTDMDLMLYADGELSPEEEAEVRAALEAEGREEVVLESMAQVGEVVRGSLELAADDAGDRLAGLWDRVERRLGANGQAEGAPASPVPEASRPGLWERITGWLDEHRGHMGAGLVGAAAAAALVLLLRPPDQKVVEVPGPERIVQVPSESTSPMVPVSSEPAVVEELSVNDGTGHILTIPGEEGENDTTVIWIEPEESEVEGPI